MLFQSATFIASLQMDPSAKTPLSAPPLVLVELLFLECLLSNFQARLGDKQIDSIVQGIMNIVLRLDCNDSERASMVQERIASLFSRILDKQGTNPSIARLFIQKLGAAYWSLLEQLPESGDALSADDNDEAEASSRVAAANRNRLATKAASTMRSLADAISATPLVTNIGSVCEILLHAVVFCHEPAIRRHSPAVWKRFLQCLPLEHDANKTLHDFALYCAESDTLLRRLNDESTASREAITGALSWAVSSFEPDFTLHVVGFFGRLIEPCTANLSAVSADDYAIFCTPPGDLYDRSVLAEDESGGPGKAGEKTARGNVKRESKTYSFKEQMAELELRREMEAKRREKAAVERAAGKLSPGQERRRDAQLAKEAAIRADLQLLRGRVRRLLALLRSTAEAASTSPLRARRLGERLHTVIPMLAPLLQSELTSADTIDTWIALGDGTVGALFMRFRQGAMAEAQHFAALMFVRQCGYATIRSYAPSSEPPFEWLGEELGAAITHSLRFLYASLSSSGRSDDATLYGADDNGESKSGEAPPRKSERKSKAWQKWLSVELPASAALVGYAYHLVEVAVLPATRAAPSLGSELTKQLSNDVAISALESLEFCLRACTSTTETGGNFRLRIDMIPCRRIVELLLEVSPSTVENKEVSFF